MIKSGEMAKFFLSGVLVQRYKATMMKMIKFIYGSDVYLQHTKRLCDSHHSVMYLSIYDSHKRN